MDKQNTGSKGTFPIFCEFHGHFNLPSTLRGINVKGRIFSHMQTTTSTQMPRNLEHQTFDIHTKSTQSVICLKSLEGKHTDTVHGNSHKVAGFVNLGAQRVKNLARKSPN